MNQDRANQSSTSNNISGYVTCPPLQNALPQIEQDHEYFDFPNYEQAGVINSADQHSQCYQPMDELKIETYGGETAGSGYNWVTEFSDETTNLNAIRKAQETGIAMVRSCIKITQEELLRTRHDEQMLAEFIAVSYEEEFTMDRSKYNFAVLVKEVKDLEDEISSLHMLSPQFVPPIRSSSPIQRVTWKCLRCLEENDLQSYRCQCLFPRLDIDPLEAQNCCCSICTKVSVS